MRFLFSFLVSFSFIYFLFLSFFSFIKFVIIYIYIAKYLSLYIVRYLAKTCYYYRSGKRHKAERGRARYFVVVLAGCCGCCFPFARSAVCLRSGCVLAVVLASGGLCLRSLPVILGGIVCVCVCSRPGSVLPVLCCSIAEARTGPGVCAFGAALCFGAWCLIAFFSLLFVVFVLVFHNSATTYFYIVLLCIIYKNTAYYGGIFYIYSTKIGHLFLIKLLCFCVFYVIIKYRKIPQLAAGRVCKRSRLAHQDGNQFKIVAIKRYQYLRFEKQ